MSEPKNHHYVPQFYLRNFSIDENEIAVRLYLYAKDKLVTSAAISNVASKKYLYGKDNEIEKELGYMEGIVADVFKTWVNILHPPDTGSNALGWVNNFILIQLFRTIKAGKNLNSIFNKTYELISKVMSNENLSTPYYKLNNDDAVIFSLAHTSDKLPFLEFLSVKTLENNTKFPFITSDSPVVRYNQWMESKGVIEGATAIAVKGLQIFLPIHPRVMICLYDNSVYKCGQKSKNIIKVESEKDIFQLNALQYLTSDASLFCDSNISHEYLRQVVQTYQKKREEIKHTSKVIENGNFINGKFSQYIMSSFIDPHIKLDLSFFKILKKAKDIALPNNLPLMRHESFYELQRKDNKKYYS